MDLKPAKASDMLSPVRSMFIPIHYMHETLHESATGQFSIAARLRRDSDIRDWAIGIRILARRGLDGFLLTH